MGLIEDAMRRREAADAAAPRIDYDLMKQIRPRQQRELTAAIKGGDAERIAVVCKQHIAEWNKVGMWPDDWSRWQRALDDALPWNKAVLLEDL